MRHYKDESGAEAAMDCPVCNTKDVNGAGRSSTGVGWHNGVWVECPQCGPFILDHAAKADIARRSIDSRIVSAWIRDRNNQGVDVVIRTTDIDQLAALPFPAFKERVEHYLFEVAKRSTSLETAIDYREPQLIAAAYCRSPSELQVIIEHLQEQGYLENTLIRAQGRLTPKGHMYADELRTRHAISSQGFIAMWFDQSMESARREGLEPGIRGAGYKPHRVDDAQHIDKIDDRIIAEIRRSKFLVADLTGHRGGVYYEAGFALGLGKPVFYTCRSDHAEAIHFDIRQFNYIKWDTPTTLAAALQARIEAVLGAGPEATG